VASVSPGGAERIAQRGFLPPGVTVSRLERDTDGAYTGELREPSSILIAEVADRGWQARVGSAILRPGGDELVRIDEVPDGTVTVTHTGATARGLAVTGQLLAVLLAISLALRPPSFARSFAGDGTPDAVLGGRPPSGSTRPRAMTPPPPPASDNVEVEA
jgi:hypothetical protein